jgi:hypothetical protein
MTLIDTLRDRLERAAHMLHSAHNVSGEDGYVNDRISESLQEVNEVLAALEQYEVVEGEAYQTDGPVWHFSQGRPTDPNDPYALDPAELLVKKPEEQP